jgi:DNA polymerase-1
MLAFVIRLVREHEPAGIVAAFDVPSVETFRHRLYPGYQGQRGPLGGDSAPDFARQVDIARSLFPLLGVPAIEAPAFEADDVMGTIAVRSSERGDRSLIVSTDRDLLQLVRPGIQVLSPGNPPKLAADEDGVRARLGVGPSGVTTFKALAGDPSDNIPGVRGIGGKTAASLVNTYGTLEAIYDRAADLPGRVATALAAGRQDAFLYRQVATIATDLDLGVLPPDLPLHRIEPDAKPRRLLEVGGHA